jgi:hypothetical protein
LELQAQALGSGGHPVIGIGGGAGEGEKKAGIRTGFVQEPAPQGVRKLCACGDVEHEPAFPREVCKEKGEALPGIAAAAQDVAGDLVQTEQERDEGRAREGGGQLADERSDPLQALGPGLLVRIRAPGELMPREPGEPLGILLIAFEVQGEDGDRSSDGAGRGFEEAGPAASGIAREEENGRRAGGREKALDLGQGFRMMEGVDLELFGGRESGRGGH